MNENLLKQGIREIIASKGTFVFDICDDIVNLFIRLQQRECVANYGVSFTDENDNDYYLLVPLTNEQIEEIKQASVVDGEEWDYDDVLERLCADKEYLQIEGPGGSVVPNHIDLDNPHYLYDIEVALFPDGLHNKPEIIKRKVDLSNDEYAWLITRHISKPHLSFNAIRGLNQALYNKMCEFIENNIDSIPVTPPAYAVELIKIKEDAALLDRLIGECKMEINN